MYTVLPLQKCFKILYTAIYVELLFLFYWKDNIETSILASLIRLDPKHYRRELDPFSKYENLARSFF